NTDLVVNTTGCRIRAIAPLSATVRRYMERMKPFRCPSVQLFVPQTLEGRNFLVRNISKSGLLACCGVRQLRRVTCASVEFRRENDFQNKYSNLSVFRLSEETRFYEVGSGEQTLRLFCWLDFARVIFNDVIWFLPAAGKPARQDRLSVMVLGIDSISHMHYKRYFPRVARYLRNTSHVEFWGYNRVGHNSFPNLIPLLSGQSEEELERTCHKDGQTFDNCRFLWDDFRAAGYSTLFAEDNEFTGTFTYQKRGFRRQPTDFYMRPVFWEMKQFTSFNINKLVACSGHRTYDAVHYDFIYKMMPHLQHRPFFSFFWQTQFVHDYFNYARLLDREYLGILRELKAKNISEHTLILLLSDHGFRMGGFSTTPQGWVEMSQPLFIAIYPEWMPKRYPLAMANLHGNARRLITTFDIHETLTDVLHPDRLSDASVMNRTDSLKNARGISLFLPIPESRDCAQAGIPGHFCLCHSFERISIDEVPAKDAAELAVQKINALIAPYPQCQQLRLQEIREAYVSNRRLPRVLVRLLTSPGNGLFSATVFMSDEGILKLDGTVTRNNKYGDQAHCIQNFRIEMYCYCL
ncbi:hypothetical protein KR018_004385, partial [Drosophila ironensis]